MKNLLLISMVLVILIGCTTDPKQTLLTDIEKVNNAIASDTVTSLDTELINKAISLYDKFVEDYPKDELVASYVFKSGELAMSVNMHSRAITYFDRISTDYNAFEKAPISIFLMAFIYENHLHNKDKAKVYYQKFISQYPNHEFAKDAKTSLENIDIPIEEIIRRAKAKEASKKDSII